ncbi:MAG: 2Fe-2S iron-sulfur cluster-binding protein [Pseudomonadota bacterium]
MTVYTIHYRDNAYQCRSDETVLDAMLRQGVELSFSCRHGICHVCLHRAESGRLPPESQKGLDAAQQEAGFFLPCCCKPVDDLTIVPAEKDAGKKQAKMQSRYKAGPDPEMWAALDEGRLLTAILEDFYGRVFEDERLAPFFEGVTRQRAIEKQFLFLRQQFTGEKVYFGDRPKNAHHWMVISDELFDYREGIMVETLRRHGLPAHLVERWRLLEDSFRDDIVKDKPWKRKMGDIELPVEGYGELVMETGSLCDGCGEEIDAGETIRYHLRMGHVYCPTCMQGRV